MCRDLGIEAVADGLKITVSLINAIDKGLTHTPDGRWYLLRYKQAIAHVKIWYSQDVAANIIKTAIKEVWS